MKPVLSDAAGDVDGQSSDREQSLDGFAPLA